MSNTQLDDILARLSNDTRAKVAITDIDGILRGKYIHIDKLKSALTGGFGFCDVVLGWDMADECYDNAAFTGWHSGYPDAEVRLDPSTFRRVPWDDSVPFFLGDFVNGDETPLAVCPRQLLKKVIRRADDLGFSAKFGVEFEWFNFRETPQSLADKSHVNPTPITPGMFGYSVLRSSLNSGFFKDIMDMLGAFGVPVEGLHTETGPGVVEAAIANTTPLEAADRAVLFKSGVKEIAYRHGMIASFMAKWNASLPGSSGHLHQSLWNAEGENVFYDPQHPHGMSDMFKSYIAGQLKLLPAILPLLAPTVNSFKRLVEGMWAPTRLTWAIDNRTVALRVIPGSPKSTRLELRVGGADLNPYLGIAAALAAGLYGIENQLKLEHAPIVGNGYEADAEHLPRDLDGAADQLEASSIARSLFGDAFVDHFVQSRRWEARQYRAAVTDWELKRYFELV
ncbi:MAG: glutamine synthetase family protein [Myxococcota bacterium]|nr:glutamine synthetase family protein [Myxococcota bacterium]